MYYAEFKGVFEILTLELHISSLLIRLQHQHWWMMFRDHQNGEESVLLNTSASNNWSLQFHASQQWTTWPQFPQNFVPFHQLRFKILNPPPTTNPSPRPRPRLHLSVLGLKSSLIGCLRQLIDARYSGEVSQIRNFNALREKWTLHIDIEFDCVIAL